MVPETVLHVRVAGLDALRLVAEGTPIDVPVVPLDTLHGSGILGSAAAKLAERLLQRAAAHS